MVDSTFRATFKKESDILEKTFIGQARDCKREEKVRKPCFVTKKKAMGNQKAASPCGGAR